MSRRAAVVEDGVGVIHNLVEHEADILLSGREGLVISLVTHRQLRRLGDSVVVRVPHEADSVTRGRVDESRRVAEDAWCRSYDDSVDSSRATVGA